MSSPAHKRRPPLKPRQKKQNASALGTCADLPVADAYAQLLGELKRRIASAQTRAHMAVCHELILLYWQTGRDIVLSQKQEGWGKSVIERLAKDLQDSFPGIEGFSANNIWRMRAFYLAYFNGDTILAQPVQELAEPSAILLGIPWGHNITLIQKI